MDRGTMDVELRMEPASAGQGELRRQNEYLAALHDTALALMERLDLGELLGAIVTRAAKLCGTEHGYIYLVDGDHLEVRAGTGVFHEKLGFRMSHGEGLAGKIWESGEALTIADYDTWAGRSRAWLPGLLHAVTGVPFVSGDGQVAGVLGLGHVEPGRSFSDDDLTLLAGFAELASLALDNAQLFAAAQLELEERARVEGELRDSEARYRVLFDANPQPMWVFDVANLGFLAVNDAAIERYGYSREEFIGMTVGDICPPEDLAALKRELAQPHDGVNSGVWRHRLQDGTLIDVEVATHATWFGDRRARLVAVTDLTERRRAQEELERALEQEREAARRLRAIDEMKNTFLSAVSHELRTPLTSVVGFAQTLERKADLLTRDQTSELLRRLSSKARKLEALLTDLLDLDRLSRGILELRRRPTDVGELVRRVVEESELGEFRPVEVETTIAVVWVDGPKVERIVENLLANTARHTPEGTPVWVRVRTLPDGILIVVEDAGPGVPEGIRRTVFEPFSQGPGVPQHSPGVGIGLSLVADFAKLHGGRAWIEERGGGGASFRVFLPASEPVFPSSPTRTPGANAAER